LISSVFAEGSTSRGRRKAGTENAARFVSICSSSGFEHFKMNQIISPLAAEAREAQIVLISGAQRRRLSAGACERPGKRGAEDG
jgi:hypothetical protein